MNAPALHVGWFGAGDDRDELAQALWELHGHYAGDAAPALAAVRRNLDEAVLVPGSGVRVAVAREGARLAALATVAWLYPAPGAAGQMQMKDLYVREPWRGRGLGRALMAYLAGEALRSGCVRLDWTAERGNASALAFYDALGAQRVEEKVYCRFDQARLQALVARDNALHIRLDDLRDPRVVDLLAYHRQSMFEWSPPESVHTLDLNALRHPDLQLWTAWSGGDLLGCAALKRLGAGHGEVKSMRTAPGQLRRGVARALLAHVEAAARAAGLTRLSLETGTVAAFEPAHRLYEACGFERCGPFDGYVEDPHSLFMTKAL